MKKYLKTPKEVINALYEGKEIKTDDGNCYKMIDGILCYFGGGGWTVGIYIKDAEKPYIEETEPLKFEVGKFYKNRVGRKYICCFVAKDKDNVFVDVESGHVMLTGSTGRYLVTKEAESDIIGEWEE